MRNSWRWWAKRSGNCSMHPYRTIPVHDHTRTGPYPYPQYHPYTTTVPQQQAQVAVKHMALHRSDKLYLWMTSNKGGQHLRHGQLQHITALTTSSAARTNPTEAMQVCFLNEAVMRGVVLPRRSPAGRSCNSTWQTLRGTCTEATDGGRKLTA